VQTITCPCGAVIGQRAGAVILVRHGGEVLVIEGAVSVTRTCRKCKRENRLTEPAEPVSANILCGRR
jgi:hypothetical protein